MIMSFWKRIRRYRRKCYNETVVPEKEAPQPIPVDRDTFEESSFYRGIGSLDPRSSTWLFIHSWAQERLDKARLRNDSANADIIQTSVMRGEIKVLKELISLPVPKPGKGLLEDED